MTKRFIFSIVCSFLASLSVAACSAGTQDELPRKASFGAQLAPVPADVRTKAGLKEGEGLLLPAILPGQTAAAIGLKANDVLLAIDGKAVTGNPSILQLINNNPAGKEVKFEVFRDGKKETVTGKLLERPRETSDQYDVVYTHVLSNGKRMRMVVTKPKAPGKYPAMVLIQGLGPAVMDVPLTGQGSYHQILRAFATDGWVTVRVDKPGVGDSEGGPYETVDYDTEMDIYRQAIAASKKLNYVDPDKMFVFGHSMGGAFGPIVGSETRLRGIAVVGTVAKTWTEYFLENTRRQELLAGRTLEQVDMSIRNQAAAMTCLLDLGMTPAEVKAKFPKLTAAVDDVAPNGLMYGRPVAFWSQLANYNFPEYWKKVDAHVLAVWGENEFITTEEDHPLIVEVVNKARPGKAKYVKLAQSDHGFKKTTSMEDSFRRWGQPGEFNPNIVEALKAWTKEVLAG
jgi:pimeloyl-ACP methyl ester carboxylesterase